MFTFRRELTRPERARRYDAALVLPALLFLFLVWGPRWYASSGDGYRYEAVTAWGVFHYLQLREAGLVGASGAPMPQSRQTEFNWVAVPQCLATTLIVLGVLIALHRAIVRTGALRGRCDECGYDLRGLASSRCPECGQAFEPGEAAPVTAKPVNAEASGAQEERWEGQRRRMIWTIDRRVGR